MADVIAEPAAASCPVRRPLRAIDYSARSANSAVDR